ncbi:hypothetical protein [Planosporangium mesophilum]|uniref:Uncharacterized protein n=1 Tax=Planosporangium mesophilum TaxID=689768 RepID=A0A8J3TD87_9ACTN|nr:hypothetical protein [Planosporangium mesophilum]GII25015.1 hypothetical protein Pme01_46120 [Planosporangium mesophilum]
MRTLRRTRRLLAAYGGNAAGIAGTACLVMTFLLATAHADVPSTAVPSTAVPGTAVPHRDDEVAHGSPDDQPH